MTEQTAVASQPVHRLLKVERAAQLKTHAVLDRPSIYIGPPGQFGDSLTTADVRAGALEHLASGGSLAAATELGIRLVGGLSIERDAQSGARLLRSSAERGDPLAMLALAQFLRAGDLSHGTLSEARAWFARAGATEPAKEPLLGSKLYKIASARTSGDLRAFMFAQAASMLFTGFLRGQTTPAAGLAYMIRRKEVSPTDYPPLDDLLSKGLRVRHPFAMVTHALQLAAQGEWEAADSVIAILPGSHGVLEWWTPLLAKAEPEASLVIGWLLRHGLAVDPERLPLDDRFAAAKPAWPIPVWMLGHA